MSPQNKIILKHIRQYGGITQLTAAHAYNILRLSERIREIEAERGKELRHQRISDDGKTWVRYSF